jgi:hypothetical protein
MRKGKLFTSTSEDREKLEETVKAAEDMIALLKQFKVPINKSSIRAVNKAREYLDETNPIKVRERRGLKPSGA